MFATTSAVGHGSYTGSWNRQYDAPLEASEPTVTVGLGVGDAVPIKQGVPTCSQCGGTSFVPRRKTSTKVMFGLTSLAADPTMSSASTAALCTGVQTSEASGGQHAEGCLTGGGLGSTLRPPTDLVGVGVLASRPRAGRRGSGCARVRSSRREGVGSGKGRVSVLSLSSQRF